LKSGGVTISYLRFGPKPIKSSYLIDSGCTHLAMHKKEYIFTLKARLILAAATEGSTLVLNNAELSEKLPDPFCRLVGQKKMKVFAIDAATVAKKTGMGRLIINIMTAVFFKSLGVLPVDQALCLLHGADHARGRDALEALLAVFAEPSVEPTEVDVNELVLRLRETSSQLCAPLDEPAEDDVNSEASDDSPGLLCSCTVTLACGAATLLTNARLRLARGRVYGLLRANDCGKSTLLRAIHERHVAAFPTVGELVTSLVEHGVGEKPPECNRTPLEFLFADPCLRELDLERSQVSSALQPMGFDQGGRLKKPSG